MRRKAASHGRPLIAALGVMSTATATIRVLGILTGTLSVVSLIQSVMKVGLLTTLSEVLTFYRDLSGTVFGVPARFFGWMPPQAILDLWVLSFIGAGAYVRTSGIENSRALRFFNLNGESWWWKIVLLLVLGFSGAGISILLLAATPTTCVDSFQEDPADLMKGAGANVVFVCLGALGFFALNAFLPSV